MLLSSYLESLASHLYMCSVFANREMINMAEKHNIELESLGLEDFRRIKNPFKGAFAYDSNQEDNVEKLIEIFDAEDDDDDLYFEIKELKSDYTLASSIFKYLGGMVISYDVKAAFIDFFERGDLSGGGCGWFIEERDIDNLKIVVLTDLELIYASSDYHSMSEICIVV